MHHLEESSLPPLLKLGAATMKAKNPGWTYKYWTDRDLIGLMEKEYPSLLPIFKGCKTGVQRGDMGRLLVLYHEGGVYVDLDIEARRNFERLFEYADEKKFIVAAEPAEQVALLYAGINKNKNYLCNAFIYAPPRFPLVKRFLDIIENMYHQYGDAIFNQFDIFGAKMLSTVYSSQGQRSQFSIIDTELIYPINDLKLKTLPSYERDIAFLNNLTACAELANSAAETIMIHYWVHGDFEGKSMLPKFLLSSDSLAQNFLKFVEAVY